MLTVLYIARIKWLSAICMFEYFVLISAHYCMPGQNDWPKSVLCLGTSIFTLPKLRKLYPTPGLHYMKQAIILPPR